METYDKSTNGALWINKQTNKQTQTDKQTNTLDKYNVNVAIKHDHSLFIERTYDKPNRGFKTYFRNKVMAYDRPTQLQDLKNWSIDSL